MKIIIITSNSLRHKYLAAKFAKCKSVHLEQVFIEKNFKTKISQFKENKLKKYLIERNKCENKFFKKYVDKNYNKKLEIIINENKINSKTFLKRIININPDFIISFGCSIVKSDILELYKNKFINIHLGISPYMKGAGTNFFSFYLKKPELFGATIMFISRKLDDGNIIHHTQADIGEKDNLHTIGFKLIKKTISELIKILSSKKKLKSRRIKNVKNYYFRRKDFDVKKLKEVEEYLKSKIYFKNLKKSKKIKLVNFFKN